MASHDQSYKVDEIKPEVQEKPTVMETIKIKTKEVTDKIFKKTDGTTDTTTAPVVNETKDQTQDYAPVTAAVVTEKAPETTESPHEEPAETHTPKYGGLETTPSQGLRVFEEAAEVAQETLHVGEVAKDGTEKYGTSSTADKE